MPETKLFFDAITLRFKTGPDIREITSDLQGLIAKSGMVKGLLNASMVGSTGSLTTIEYEPGVVEDLKQAINRLAPQGMEYAHELAWHDGNGHSHVQAALMGPSLALAIRNKRLKLGTWQQVVAINHDNKSRNRTIEITLVGI